MINILDTCGFDIGRRFFAANTTSAEHGNLRCSSGSCQIGLVFIEPFRKLPEGFSVRIDCPVEASKFNFVIVPGINHDCVGIGDQGIPVFRLHIGSDKLVRVGPGDPHCHDFRLDFNLETEEWHVAAH